MSARGTVTGARGRSLLRQSFVGGERSSTLTRTSLLASIAKDTATEYKSFGNISLTYDYGDLPEEIENHTITRSKASNNVERTVFSIQGFGEMHVLAAELATINSFGTNASDSEAHRWFLSPDEEERMGDGVEAILTVARDWTGAYALFFIDPKITKTRTDAVMAAMPLLAGVAVASDEPNPEKPEMHDVSLIIDDAQINITLPPASRNQIVKAVSVGLGHMYPTEPLPDLMLTRLLSVDFSMTRINQDNEVTKIRLPTLKERAGDTELGSLIEDEVNTLKVMPLNVPAQVCPRLLLFRKMTRDSESRNHMMLRLLTEVEAQPGPVELKPLLMALEQFALHPSHYATAMADITDTLTIVHEKYTRDLAEETQVIAKARLERGQAELHRMGDEMAVLRGLVASFKFDEGRASIAPSTFPQEFLLDELEESLRGVVKQPWQAGLRVAALVYDKSDNTVLVDSSGNLPSAVVGDAGTSPMRLEEVPALDIEWLLTDAVREAREMASRGQAVTDTNDLRGKMLNGLVTLSKTLDKPLGTVYDRFIALTNPARRDQGMSTPESGTGTPKPDAGYLMVDTGSPESCVRLILTVQVIDTGCTDQSMKKSKRRALKEQAGWKVKGSTWDALGDVELALYHSYAGVSKNAALSSLPSGYDGVRFVPAALDFHDSRHVPDAALSPGVHLAQVNLLTDITGSYVLVDSTTRQIPTVPLPNIPAPTTSAQWAWVQSVAARTRREGADVLLHDPASTEDMAVQPFQAAFIAARDEMIAAVGQDEAGLGQLMDQASLIIDEQRTIEFLPFVIAHSSEEVPAQLGARFMWRRTDIVEAEYAARYQPLRLSQFRADLASGEADLRDADMLARETGDAMALKTARQNLVERGTTWNPMRWLAQVQNWVSTGMVSILDLVEDDVMDTDQPYAIVIQKANDLYIDSVGGVTNRFLFDLITARIPTESAEDNMRVLKTYYSGVIGRKAALYRSHLGLSDGQPPLSIPPPGKPGEAAQWQIVDSSVRKLLGISYGYGEEVTATAPIVRPPEQVALGTPPLESVDLEFSLDELLAKVDFKLTSHDICRCLVEEYVESALVQTVDLPIFDEVERTLDDAVEVVVATTDLVEDAVWSAIHTATRASLDEEKRLLDAKMDALFTQALPDLADLPADPEVPVDGVEPDVTLPAKPSPLSYADLLTPYTGAIRQAADRFSQLVQISHEVLEVIDSARDLGMVVDTVTDLNRIAQEKLKTATRKADRAKKVDMYNQTRKLKGSPDTTTQPSPDAGPAPAPATATVRLTDIVGARSTPKSPVPARPKPKTPRTPRRIKLQGSAQTEQFIRGLKTLNSVYHATHE